MNIGDYLLKSNKITQKQREKAELEHEVSGNKFGKCCLDLGFITRTELNQAIKAVQKKQGEGVRNMATEIGEGSKFTFDLKFIVTIGAVIVSACATYFSIQGSIDELKSNNSPNRLEYDYLKGEVDNIKATGDLKIITYQLEEFKSTFSEIKTLASQLTPLASDLEYIKAEIELLKNKKVPKVDLSGIEYKLDNLSNDMMNIDERMTKLENKKDGGRF